MRRRRPVVATGKVARVLVALAVIGAPAWAAKPELTVTPEPAGAAAPTETPTPEETPGPTPTPCEGKFSCAGPDTLIEVSKGVWVHAGQRRSFVFELIESYGSNDVSIPVTMIRGTKPGPTLLLTSTIHGDELNGLPVLLQLRDRIDPENLKGLVIMLPVLNPHGFQRQTRYLPDRRDLNRYFPGNPRGSLANRIADRIFRTFVLRSDYLIDFHTAAGGRSNAPHIRADPSSPDARALAQGFGGIVVLQTAMAHTLRQAATAAGVPAAAFEGGENGRLDGRSVESGVRGVENVLASLGMLSDTTRSATKPLFMKYSPWIRASTGGIVELSVGLGDLVQENQLLLTIRDTLHGHRTEIRAPNPGVVMAVARSPVAEPGYALLRLGSIEGETEEEPAPEVEGEEEVPE